ncbi:MAG: bifunctional folylpolyglutamate synthase/dihydrofolate synthase, partial [Sinobacteraceae bacterium]|nr:bifunctional folylpolyglutamate synthase/dihydrofolate synthase [Nevskiaceae bacterium]
MRTLEQWLALHESVHPQAIDMGLERVARVARALGVERLSCPVVTVAGTNGKGATCAHLEALLRATGLSTGLFTSPHLLRYNERIRINGREVADAALLQVFEQIEQARATTTLTFFEYNTLAALLLFRAQSVQVAVLEVGLGGRLDATNLIDADVAIVCSIGFDHRDWLGETLEQIGAEKAGIFRSGRPALLSTVQMPRSVWAAIEQTGARAVVAERDYHWQRDPAAGSWSYQGLQLRLSDLPPPALSGSIQYRNAAAALAAIECLSLAVTREQAAAGLQQVHLPGRFQIVPGEIEWILDIAH